MYAVGSFESMGLARSRPTSPITDPIARLDKKPARGKAAAKPKPLTKNVVAKKPAAKKKAPAKKKVAKV